MADDINYQLILTKLEEKLKKYRAWNDTVKVRLLTSDIQQLKAYLNHQRNTPPNLSRWLRVEDYRRTALLLEKVEANSKAQTPARVEETIELEERQPVESTPQSEPPVAPADLVAEGAPAADEVPTVEAVVSVEEEPQQPNPEETQTVEAARTAIAEAVHPVAEEPQQPEQAAEETVTQVQTPTAEEPQPDAGETEEISIAEAAHPVAEEPRQPEQAADETVTQVQTPTAEEPQQPMESEEGFVEGTEAPAVDVVPVESPATEDSSAAELEPYGEEEEPQAMLSAEEIAAEASNSGRSSERFQEEIRRIEEMRSGSDEDLAAALQNCENLSHLPDLSDASRMQLGSLKREVEEERDRRYTDWMEKGRTARKENRLEDARIAFSAAYQLKRSLEAENTLSEINRNEERKGDEVKLRILESDLAIRTDNARLEKAVREAEALWVNGQLPDQLVETMHKAREAFDRQHALMGGITTAASMGDLSDAKDAVTKIEKIMYDDKFETFYDAYRGYIPISDALVDANRRWEDRSRDFVAYTHSKIKKWLEEHPDQPEVAQSILQKCLYIDGDLSKPQPIYPSVDHELDIDKQRIEELISRKRQAQKKVEDVYGEDSESQRPNPSEEEIAAEAAYSKSSGERFHEEIRKIEESIKNDDETLLEAIRTCERLLNLPDLSEASRTQVISLKREAEEERDRRYAEWMEKGRTARKDDDLEKARQAFSAAYQLTRSAEAENALSEINRNEERKGDEAKLRILENDLAIRTDIARLEKAVREAEALWVNGQLPDHLVETMHNAREAFDQSRANMGQIITSAATGDLSDARNAVTKIEHLMYEEKQETFLDPVKGVIPISEALLDANHRWEDRSREFIGDTHAKVEKWLADRPDQPEIAQIILFQRLYIDGNPSKPQPIHPTCKDDLQVDKNNIEARINRKKETAIKVAGAADAVNPVAAYRLLLDAFNEFEFLPGIQPKLTRSRQLALEYILSHVVEKISNSIWEKDHFNFSTATQALHDANDFIAAWPDDKRPEELIAQNTHCAALATEIVADQYKFNVFSRRFDEVKRLEQAGEISSALEMLTDLLEDEEFSGDKRFEEYSRQDVRALTRKLNASKSAAEKLELAQRKALEQDWEEVRDLTEGLAEDQAKALNGQAKDELSIQEALQFLHEDQVARAKKILVALTNRRPELRERLQAALETIRRAVEATPAFQALYDQAERDAKKKGVTEQAGALRLFRYLGGKLPDGEPIPAHWPAYQLSLLTAPAREYAVKMGELMRATFLADLVAFYRQHQSDKSEPSEQDRRVRAEQARALRETLLLQSEDERAAARWIELKHGMAGAEAIGAAGAWDKAAAMWEELNLIYPLTPAVQEGLRKAYIQQALLHMRGHLDQGQAGQALAVLQTAQQNHELIDSVEIKFGLSTVYEQLKEFGKAQDVLKTIRSQDAGLTARVAERAAHLKREAEIQQALGRADGLEAQARADGVNEAGRRNLVRGALEALKVAQGAGNGDRSRRLDQRFNDLYRGQELHLLETIDAEIAKRTQEGNLQALLAIVDLELLEDLKEIPANKKNSRKKLALLKGTLEGLVTKLIRDARKLDPNPDNFDFTSDSAGALFDKVNDLRSKLQIVKEFSHDTRLDDHISRLSNVSANLARLLKKEDDAQSQQDSWQDTVLEGGRNSTAWQKALVTDDFSLLDRVQRNLEAMQLQQVNEAKLFITKLAEIKQVKNHLNQGINQIRGHHRSEEYSMAIEKIDALQDLHLMDDVSNLEIINDDMYKTLYEWVAPRLLVHPKKSDVTIVGWSEVRKDAEQRENNYNAWKGWMESIQLHANRAKAAVNLAQQFDTELPWMNAQTVVDTAASQSALPANSNRWLSRLVAFQTEEGAMEVFNPTGEPFKAEFLSGDYAPLTYRLWAWIAALKYMGIAWLMLEGGPDQFARVSAAIEKIDASAAHACQEASPNRTNGKSEPDLGEVLQAELEEGLEKYPVLSEKAEKIISSALTVRGDARKAFQFCVDKLQDIHNQIDNLNGYPLPGEFTILQRSNEWSRFESRLQQARKIGPANFFESETYRINKDLFLKHSEKKQSIISKLFGGV